MPMINLHIWKRIALAMLLGAVVGSCAIVDAQTRNPAINAGTKQSHKMEKQQAKAMKKYQKAQRKSQRKMEKYDHKHTHDPYRPK
jgi:Skp family chaperone for outer membrane proteins